MPLIVQLDAFGGPEVLRLVDIDPSAPRPGEASVRVGAFGLNRVEALFRKGAYLPAAFPCRIGLEAAGVVESVGEGVSNIAPGDRVAALTGVSMERHGTYGEAMLYPADMLVKIPEGQPLIEAAACWMQYVTAYALVFVAGIARGDLVAVTAASSSVGLAAIQIANAQGAIPIAITRGREKARGLREAGAAEVIVGEEGDLVERLLDISRGRGVRVAFDAVGGPMVSRLARAMSPRGVIISYGVLAGLPSDFPWIEVMAKNLTLRGWSADMLTQDPVLRAQVIGYESAGLASGALRPLIDRTFDLTQIVEAHRYLESNAQLGKVVVSTRWADG